MAGASDIRMVRINTDEQSEEIYSDNEVADLIASLGVTGAIQKIWEEKAARFSGLVSISEAGSSMSFGQLYQNAVNQAQYWQKKIDQSTVVPNERPYVNRITRDGNS